MIKLEGRKSIHSYTGLIWNADANGYHIVYGMSENVAMFLDGFRCFGNCRSRLCSEAKSAKILYETHQGALQQRYIPMLHGDKPSSTCYQLTAGSLKFSECLHGMGRPRNSSRMGRVGLSCSWIGEFVGYARSSWSNIFQVLDLSV